MSGKLMHERLREHAAKCAIGVFAVGDTEIVSLRAGEALALADEIERQYVPVPRFPDGEPVGEGSETCYGTVSCIDVEVSDGGWGNWVLHFDDGNCIEGTFSHRVERPAPKLLDADGVEINVGDTVYSVNYGKAALEVIELPRSECYQSVVIRNIETGSKGGFDAPQLTHIKPVFDADGVRICVGDTVWYLFESGIKITVESFRSEMGTTFVCGDGYSLRPENVTHREPDSLEKLRDEMTRKRQALNAPSMDELETWVDRLTALMERGAR